MLEVRGGEEECPGGDIADTLPALFPSCCPAFARGRRRSCVPIGWSLRRRRSFGTPGQAWDARRGHGGRERGAGRSPAPSPRQHARPPAQCRVAGRVAFGALGRALAAIGIRLLAAVALRQAGRPAKAVLRWLA